jgi:hypothetical protein
LEIKAFFSHLRGENNFMSPFPNYRPFTGDFEIAPFDCAQGMLCFFKSLFNPTAVLGAK